MDDDTQPSSRAAMLPEATAATAAHLATFPFQNPNAVIELDLAGRVRYLNPEAMSSFPTLAARGADHPLMSGVMEAAAQLRDEGRESLSREIEVHSAVFEQKVCYSALEDAEIVRIYNHDVTAHRRAEQALHELARRVVEAQEVERKRISRELHDEAGQALAALKIGLNLLAEDPPDDVHAIRTDLRRAVELVDETRERIRMLAHDLRPPALDAIGLDDTLEDFARAFGERTRLHITYQGSPSLGLDEASEICLYRCLQEALTNVAVHAGASRASVSLNDRGETVSLEIEDDGIGIDEPKGAVSQPSSSGLGLLGMRERLEMLGGRLEIDSGSNGTCIRAVLPHRRAAE